MSTSIDFNYDKIISRFIYAECCSTPSVESIDVSHIVLFGSIPAVLASMKSLRVLLASNNFFKGNIPPYLGTMTQFTQLDFSNNYLTCRDLSFLTTLSNLQVFHRWHRTPFLTFWQVLNLGRNRISSVIPVGFSKLSNLQYLNISHNNMQGNIPEDMFFVRATRLDISNNQLSGNVSPFTSDPEYLDVSNNHFNGTINFVNSLSSVQFLNASNNNFSGNIADFSQKLSLYSLDLSNNLLEGSVPSLSRLSKLQVYF